MRVIKWGKGSLFVYVFQKYRFLSKNTGLWASKYRFVFPEVGMSAILAKGQAIARQVKGLVTALEIAQKCIHYNLLLWLTPVACRG